MAELLYPTVIAAARLSFVGAGPEVHDDRPEHIPRYRRRCLAINHTGYMDFTFAGLGAHPGKRLVRFMAKDQIWKHPVAGPLMRGMKHIPVDRDAGAASYNAAVTRSEDGEIVGVFPEATISPSFELLPFKQGAARMAMEADVPLIPMILWGSQRVIGYHTRKPLTQRRLPITITIGEPLKVGARRGRGRGDPAPARRHDRDAAPRPGHLSGRSRPGPADTWWLPTRLGGTAPTPEEGQQLANARKKKAQESS